MSAYYTYCKRDYNTELSPGLGCPYCKEEYENAPDGKGTILTQEDWADKRDVERMIREGSMSREEGERYITQIIERRRSEIRSVRERLESNRPGRFTPNPGYAYNPKEHNIDLFSL